MSIYCTRLSLDNDDPPDFRDGPSPIAYLGSHVRIADDAWRYGSLDTAHIPEWCHIDAEPDDESTWRAVPYMRLSVQAFDEHNGNVEKLTHATVVLDEQQVRALRDDLTHWLTNDVDRA